MKTSIISTALAFMDHLREQGFKEHTVLQYQTDLMKAAGFLGEYRRVKEILPSQIELFLQSDALLHSRKGRALAPRTIERTVRVLRHYLYWLQKQKMRRCDDLLEVVER